MCPKRVHFVPAKSIHGSIATIPSLLLLYWSVQVADLSVEEGIESDSQACRAGVRLGTRSHASTSTLQGKESSFDNTTCSLNVQKENRNE